MQLLLGNEIGSLRSGTSSGFVARRTKFELGCVSGQLSNGAWSAYARRSW